MPHVAAQGRHFDLGIALDRERCTAEALFLDAQRLVTNPLGKAIETDTQLIEYNEIEHLGVAFLKNTLEAQ